MGRFQDKLQLNILESQSRLVPLQAYGQGTTIVSDPPLLSVMDLGPNFRWHFKKWPGLIYDFAEDSAVFTVWWNIP